MTNGEEIRERWLSDKDLLDRFGEYVKVRIADRLRAIGIWADIQSRTKSIDSILKKLLTKKHHTYDTLPDLVGVRVVVRYRHEVDQLKEVVEELFRCDPPDDKSARLAHEKVGYLSVHTEARLKDDTADAAIFSASGFRAEIQMRTLAQHLWSEMSHDTFYKTDASGGDVRLSRRVNLMAGLLEVADMEFERLGKEVAGLPNMEEISVLKHLEPYYFQFTAERGSRELSLEVIRLLLPLYKMDAARIGPLLEAFIHERRDTIIAVFNEQAALPDRRSIFFTQPEVLMLYERLERDLIGLRELWVESFPIEELERVAVAFGFSFD